MPDSTKRSATRNGIRFRLGTLLLLVTLLGVVAAWISDHHRLDERNSQLLIANNSQRDQINALKQQLQTRTMGMQITYWWANADEYVKMLKTAADEETFLEKAPSLATADQLVVDDAVKQLILLLNAPDETTVERALTSLRFTQEAAPSKLTNHVSSIVSAVLPLLDSDSETIVGTSIGTVESFGPAASDAIPQLRKRMNDDGDWYAPHAATAIAKIEPTTQIGTRLIELVQMKHPNWYFAAYMLPRYVDVDTAQRVLDGAYKAARDDNERNMVTTALNQIPPTAKAGLQRDPNKGN